MSTPKHGVIADEQVRRVLDAMSANEHLREALAIVKLLLNTGIRIQELGRLRLMHVESARRRLAIPAQYNDQVVRYFPLGSRTLEVLEFLKQRRVNSDLVVRPGFLRQLERIVSVLSLQLGGVHLQLGELRRWTIDRFGKISVAEETRNALHCCLGLSSRIQANEMPERDCQILAEHFSSIGTYEV